MTTEFRDAIAQAANTAGPDRWSPPSPDEIADAVVAMPEMKAIKAYIREDVDGAETAAEAREWLNSLLLPDSVIDWVLGDDDD